MCKDQIIALYSTTSGVTGVGGIVPPKTSDWEISADLQGKKRQGKRGENLEEKKENCKREGGKLKMEGGKITKWEDFFFFLLVTFQKPLKFVWVYKNGNCLIFVLRPGVQHTLY